MVTLDHLLLAPIQISVCSKAESQLVSSVFSQLEARQRTAWGTWCLRHWVLWLQGSKSGVFTKWMACESTVILYEAFVTHIFEGSLLHHDKGDLSKLSSKMSSKKEACWMAECVLGVWYYWRVGEFDLPILVHSIIGHDQVNSLLHEIVLDDFDNGEAIHSKEVSICIIPNGACCRGWIVEIHFHACFLWTLTSENVYGGGLHNFSGLRTFSPWSLIVSILTTILSLHIPMWWMLTLSSSPGSTIPTKVTSYLQEKQWESSHRNDLKELMQELDWDDL